MAGSWWATKWSIQDKEGRQTRSVEQSIRVNSTQEHVARLKELLSIREHVQFLTLPLPNLRTAKRRVAENGDGFEDRIVLLQHEMGNGRWAAMFDHLRAAEQAAHANVGMTRIRIEVEKSAGRNVEAQENILKLAKQVVADDLPVISQRGDWRSIDQYWANDLLGASYNISDWNEYGRLVYQLRPVFDRQEVAWLAMDAWNRKQLQVLDNLRRPQEALKLHRAIAETAIGEVSQQTGMASRLAGMGQVEESLTLLQEQIARKDHWDASEINQFRDHYANELESRGRYREVLPLLREWLQDKEANSGIYARILTAEIMTDQVAEVQERITNWLAIVENETELTEGQKQRVIAAIESCLGRGHRRRYYNGLDRSRMPDLYRLAKTCLQSEELYTLAQNVVNDGVFRQSDAGDRLRANILGWILREIENPLIGGENENRTMPVSAGRLGLWIRTLQGGRLLQPQDDEAIEIRQVTNKEWQEIADGLLAWWDDLSDEKEKYALFALIDSVHRHSLPDRRLPYLRRCVERESADYHSHYLNSLYEALLAEPWTDAVEQEILSVWHRLVPIQQVDASKGGVAQPATRAMQLVAKLYRMVDRLEGNRIAAALQEQQDQGEVDQATRTELQKSHQEIVRDARRQLADRLRSNAQHLVEEQPLVARLLDAEVFYLEIRTLRGLDQANQWAWGELGETPTDLNHLLEAMDDTESADTEMYSAQESERVELRRLELHLRDRAWATVQYLAARKKADPAWAVPVIAYATAGVKHARTVSDAINQDLNQDGQTADKGESRVDLTGPWKSRLVDVLLLFDRPDELRLHFEAWIAQDGWNSPWSMPLALLHAELGELNRAIQIAESARAEDALSPSDLNSLADWYLVEDQREAYERARIESFKSMQEYQLRRILQEQINVLNQPGMHELEDETFLVLRAIMERAPQPSHHFSYVQQIYNATRDFRVVEAVPSSILGKTQQGVYAAMNSFDHSILNNILKEATTDQLLSTVASLRKDMEAGKMPRGADENARSLALDKRALNLMEFMVERKASMVLNEPGAHADNALIALKRAASGEWQDGERLQYVQFLRQAGAATHERNDSGLASLADEQLSQMRRMLSESQVGTREHAQIAFELATILFRSFNRRQEATRLFETAMRAYAQETEGVVPYADNRLVMGYADFYKELGQWTKAESYIVKHLDVLENTSQRWVYQSYLLTMHRSALSMGARTSLGSGRVLFDNLVDYQVDLCKTSDDNIRYDLLNRTAALYDSAVQKQFRDVGNVNQALIEFANQRLPELMVGQINNYSSLVSRFSGSLSRFSSLEALAFLLDRYEDYPTRLRYSNQDPWQSHGWQFGEYRRNAVTRREDVPRMAKLEKRLLAIVLAELRRDLIENKARNRAVYSATNSYFWSSKRSDFIALAEEIVRERSDSPRTILYVAEYFYRSLQDVGRAIDVLKTAHDKGLLDDSGKLRLITFLHEKARYRESIAILESLVEEQPDDMSRRVLLLRSYFYARRVQQFNALFADTETHFHDAGRWIESNIHSLAQVSAETKQYDKAAGFYEEAISLRQNTAPNRGVGDGQLANYYTQLAGVYTQLEDTEKAIDAAAAAVVSWGSHQDSRQDAIEGLHATISAVRDMGGLIASLDEKAKRMGSDSPLIRRLVGKTLYERKRYREAVVQYRLSLELQPYDKTAHQELIECFKAQEDYDGLVQQLLAQIDFDRHQLPLYTELANWSRKRDPNSPMTERAATSIVESAPSEAESHQALAELRQSQKRWQDALAHWTRRFRVAAIGTNRSAGYRGSTVGNQRSRIRPEDVSETALSGMACTLWRHRAKDSRSQAAGQCHGKLAQVVRIHRECRQSIDYSSESNRLLWRLAPLFNFGFVLLPCKKFQPAPIL